MVKFSRPTFHYTIYLFVRNCDRSASEQQQVLVYITHGLRRYHFYLRTSTNTGAHDTWIHNLPFSINSHL